MKGTELFFDGNSYVLEQVSLTENSYFSVRFEGVHGCALVDLAADSRENWVQSFSVIDWKWKPENNIAHVKAEGLAGTHTLYFVPRDPETKLLSVEFAEENPVPVYEPVPEESIIDMEAALWSAVDELDRKVADAEDVRGYRSDRKVGIFYWTWRSGQQDREPLNLTKVLREYPGAEYNEDHPVWGEDKYTITSWNEPLYGFYQSCDPYIIRRHAQLLADAGVDMVMFDCTNGSLVWKESYEPLLEGFRAAKADGINVPKFAFMMNFWPNKTTEEMLRGVYQEIYAPGRYRDLWFLVDGKPMVMAYPESLPEKGKCEQETRLLDEIREFFAFRPGQPSYGYGPVQERMWGWLEKYPQHKYGCRPDGTCEMMTVGVAQNCNDEDLCTYFNNKKTYGRSYTGAFGHKLLDETSYKYGFNFEEQWNRAIDCDPEFVFVTGWNEWIMGRWHEPWVKDPNSTQLAFVDQFDLEHSRDIEMDRDGIRDNFYLQLCSNIRRFKGAKPRAIPSAPKTIHVPADFADVTPVYRSAKGTTIHRDWDGFGSTHYTNHTGRNNIVEARVARDDEYVYFMAECAENITEKTGDNHMTLYVNLTGDRSSGWEGYDLAVGRLGQENTSHTVSVESWGATGFTVIGQAEYVQEGKQIFYKVPRKLLGTRKVYHFEMLDFEFKWADNVGCDDIIDFYCDGDVAPTGRFNYVYRELGYPLKKQ